MANNTVIDTIQDDDLADEALDRTVGVRSCAVSNWPQFSG